MIILNNFIKDYRKSINQSSLEIFRILLPSLIIVDLLLRYNNLEAHYTNLGIYPKNYDFLEYLYRSGRLDLFLFSESIYYHYFIFYVGFISAFTLLIGFKTRISQIVLWLILLSIQNRNPYLSEGADIYIRVILFWSLFLPLGKTFTYKTFFNRSSILEKINYSNYQILGLYIYSLQILLIYLCSVFVKLNISYWQSGQALNLAMQVDAVRGLLSEFILNFPSLLKFSTFSALFIQILIILILLIPFNYLKRIRLVIFGLIILMHIGIMFTINVGLFPFYSIVSLLPIIPIFGNNHIYKVNTTKTYKYLNLTIITIILVSFIYVSVRLLNYYKFIDIKQYKSIHNIYKYYGNFTGLRQQWIMFSGIEFNPYIILIAKQKNNEENKTTLFKIDKLNYKDWDNKFNNYNYPHNDYFNMGYRWKKLLIKSGRKRNYKLLNNTGNYICKNKELWNIDSVEFIFFHEKFDDDFNEKTLYDCHISEYSCITKRLRIKEICNINKYD